MVKNVKNKSKVKPDPDLKLMDQLEAPASEELVLTDNEIEEMTKHFKKDHEDYRVILAKALGEFCC